MLVLHAVRPNTNAEEAISILNFLLPIGIASFDSNVIHDLVLLFFKKVWVVIFEIYGSEKMVKRLDKDDEYGELNSKDHVRIEKMMDDQQYKKELQSYLLNIHTQTSEISKTLEDQNCCILGEMEKLLELVVGAQSIASSFYLKSYLSPFTDEYSTLSNAAFRLSEKRHGGLIIVERKDSVAKFIHNGIQVNAKISVPLIETIFYPGNPLHDGALYIKSDLIISAANILPLTETSYIGRKLGTRHRAAIGLSEKTDALIIIISEETGRISFALNGKIFVIHI